MTVAEPGRSLSLPWLVTLSFWCLGVAFFCYLLATICYGAAYIGARPVAGLAAGSPAGATPAPVRFARAHDWAFHLLTAGTVAHALGLVTRWQGAGHWPTSNMHEFIGFMTFTTMVAFQVMYRMYRLPVLGAVLAPLAVVILAYAYVFPREVRPLIPALQSYWLYLHVTTAAVGEGFFAVAFGAALLYLLRTREQGESRWGGILLEAVFWATCTLAAFTALTYTLRYILDAAWIFPRPNGTYELYHLPPIIGPAGATVGEKGRLLGIPLPAWVAPQLAGVQFKGKNWNTLLFAVVLGSALYALIRWGLLRGRPFRVALAPLTRGMDPELLDEISYRAVAIGYPIFTLGGLVFGAFWAKQAWSRYWAWDPKEVWAFIAWMVYTGYLHLRINRGWEGRPSAWTAVVGFGVVLFTLIGVNLLIVGLHAYAGGD